MIDKKAWKLNDSEWFLHRENKWPLFKKEVEASLVGEDKAHVRAYLETAWKYYIGEEIDHPDKKSYRPRLNLPERIYLHPDPSVKNIRTIISDHFEKGYEKLEYQHFGIPTVYFYRLIQSGAVSDEIVKNFMQASYGNSFCEAVELRSVDLDQDLGRILYDLVSAVNGWINNRCRSYGDCTPIDDYLVQFFGACEIVKNEHVEEADWSVKKLFKTLKVFENRDSAHIEGAQKAVATLRQTLKERKDRYCSSLQAFIEEIP